MKKIVAKLLLALIAIGIVAVLFNATAGAYFTDTEQSTGNTLTITTVWSETLRPNAVGTYTTWTASAGANWECVDEVTPDEDTTYVYTSAKNLWDSYNLQNSTGSGTISNVRAYVRIRNLSVARLPAIIPGLAIGGVARAGVQQEITTSYADYYSDWAQNPATLAAWTWADIDALEVAFRSRRATTEFRVTTVWVVVKYTP